MAAWAHTSRIKSFFKQGLIESDIKTSIASVDQVVERLQVPRISSSSLMSFADDQGNRFRRSST
jgi:hypothetical protein